MNPLPVRKIGRSHTALRAAMVSTKAGGRVVQVESSLERDFCCLVEFDLNVVIYTEQPVTIKYNNAGQTHRYTPDFLVRYARETAPALVEIKYRKDLREKWAELKPKFQAAKAYAAEQGWEFLVYSEDEIRGPYLDNTKFLLRYRPPRHIARPEYTRLLLEIVAQLDQSTPQEVLLVAFRDVERQAELLPTLWFLISTGLVGCNLLLPLTMSSPLWSIDAHLIPLLHG